MGWGVLSPRAGAGSPEPWAKASGRGEEEEGRVFFLPAPQAVPGCWWFSRFSRVRLLATPCTVARRAPLSMGFPRLEYWSGLPFPSPGESSRPRDRTCVSCVAGRLSCIVNGFLTSESQGSPQAVPPPTTKSSPELLQHFILTPPSFLHKGSSHWGSPGTHVSPHCLTSSSPLSFLERLLSHTVFNFFLLPRLVMLCHTSVPLLTLFFLPVMHSAHPLLYGVSCPDAHHDVRI